MTIRDDYSEKAEHGADKLLKEARNIDQDVLVVSLVDPSLPSMSMTAKREDADLPRVLFLTDLEEALLKQDQRSEQVYQTMCHIINTVNDQYSYHQFDPLTSSPSSMSSSTVVMFGNHTDGWGFTIEYFAEIYATKFGVTKDRMLEKMWSDWYFDANRKKWTRDNNSSGRLLERAICQFVFSPIQQLCVEANRVQQYCPDRTTARLDKMIKAAQIPVDSDTMAKLVGGGRPLLRYILQQWLPLNEQQVVAATSSNTVNEDGDNATVATTVSWATTSETSMLENSTTTRASSQKRSSFRRWLSRKK